MDSSTALQHQQEMSSQTLESMLVCTKPQEEKKPRPAEQEPMKCPRCDSSNTKFCYYNNYSLSQPRYFCKSCRRYWTKGGTLRNVPVGGGCRKNKRSSSSSSSSKRGQENPTFSTNDSNPFLSHEYSSDLSLAFARLQQKQHDGQTGCYDQEFQMMGSNNNNNPSVNSSPLSNGNGLLDALRSGFLETPNGFQNNFYNGNLGSNNQGHFGHFDNVGNLGINSGGEAFVSTGGMAYQDVRTASSSVMSLVKQEGEQSNNKILWGFPWQINGGDANITTTNLDSANGKHSWNGFGSTWQGLINSPLI